MKTRLVGVLFVILVASIFTSVANASLIAYFPFNGNANDASGNGVNGTIFGDTSLTTGKIGQGYAFDGSGDYIGVSLNISPGGLPQLTMGGWVKTSGLTGFVQQIISSDNGGFDRSLELDRRNFSSLTSLWRWSAFSGSSGGVLPGPIATIDQWTFVAVVYDQTAPTDKVRLYVDGTQYLRNSTLGTGNSTLRIGSNPGNNGEWFNGVIDEVFFFDTALTNTELGNIMANGVQPVPVPGALLFLVNGLLGLLAVASKRAKS